jgi:hypothetical protein
MKTLFITLLLVVTAISQAELVQVSLTGTAQTTEMGYTAGQSYTFNWTVNDSYTQTVNDQFPHNGNSWKVESLTEKPLWTSVSGDGLTGTYSQPSGFNAPHESLEINFLGLNILAGNDDPSGSSMGLMVDGIEVREFYASELDIPGLDYSNTSYVDPAIWLADYAGVHNLSTGSLRILDEPFNNIVFTPTSATIEVIPEPNSVALLLLGASSLYLRRKRTSNQSTHSIADSAGSE